MCVIKFQDYGKKSITLYMIWTQEQPNSYPIKKI